MNVWHFDSPKRPFLCSDLSKESSSVDRYQLRNIYCYIFLQLDNAMIYMLYRKSWLKWVCRVYTWSTFEASVSPQKSARLAKNQQTSLKTLSCVLYKNTEKYRYFIFKNPGIGIRVKSRYTGIFRYTAGAWWPPEARCVTDWGKNVFDVFDVFRIWLFFFRNFKVPRI